MSRSDKQNYMCPQLPPFTLMLSHETDDVACFSDLLTTNNNNLSAFPGSLLHFVVLIYLYTK